MQIIVVTQAQLEKCSLCYPNGYSSIISVVNFPWWCAGVSRYWFGRCSLGSKTLPRCLWLWIIYIVSYQKRKILFKHSKIPFTINRHINWKQCWDKVPFLSLLTNMPACVSFWEVKWSLPSHRMKETDFRITSLS